MPSFFVPVDFSASAHKAFEYALMLAKKTQGELTLYHGYPVVVNTEVLYPTAGYFELEFSGYEERIRLEFNNFLANYDLQGTNIKRIVKAGFVHEDIQDLAKRHHADLIIMGTKGATGLKEVLVGSVTASVARSTEIPLLIIPLATEMRLPRNIVFALGLEDTDREIIQKLIDLNAWFHAQITVLRISHPSNETLENPKIAALQGFFVDQGKNNLRFESISYPDVPEGLDLYSKGVPTDLMAVYMHHYGFFERLFHQSITEQLAYHTNIPLLVLKSEKS